MSDTIPPPPPRPEGIPSYPQNRPTGGRPTPRPEYTPNIPVGKRAGDHIWNGKAWVYDTNPPPKTGLNNTHPVIFFALMVIAGLLILSIISIIVTAVSPPSKHSNGSAPYTTVCPIAPEHALTDDSRPYCLTNM